MNKTKTAVFIALFAALIGILSQLSLPLPSGVPLTLQTFAVALAATLLGAGKGTAAVGVWLLLGGVGLPLFAGFRGGIAVLLGPTGGFLWGFLLLALFCGLGKDKSLWKQLLFSLPGLVLCHACGLLWFAAATESSLSAAVVTVSLPYLPKDLLCIFSALLCANLIKKKLPLLGR